jgi:hypothetical protein
MYRSTSSKTGNPLKPTGTHIFVDERRASLLADDFFNITQSYTLGEIYCAVLLMKEFLEEFYGISKVTYFMNGR